MKDVDVLVDALRLTVPLHIVELARREVPPWASREGMLATVAARCAGVFASRGDAVQFMPSGEASYRAARVGGVALSEAVAAAALLRPETGVQVWGAHFCAGPHPGCPRRPTTGRTADMREFHALLDEFEALVSAGRGVAA